jgi:small subunit ribosomal protein S8e
MRLANDNQINVLDPKNKKVQVVEIIGVLENTANIQFVRRNIINKGAMVETSLGKVKVSSRPGQHGMVNGVLVE